MFLCLYSTPRSTESEYPQISFSDGGETSIERDPLAPSPEPEYVPEVRPETSRAMPSGHIVEVKMEVQDHELEDYQVVMKYSMFHHWSMHEYI